MNCQNCGSYIPTGVAFCPTCGAPSPSSDAPVTSPQGTQATTSYPSPAPAQQDASGQYGAAAAYGDTTPYDTASPAPNQYGTPDPYGTPAPSQYPMGGPQGMPQPNGGNGGGKGKVIAIVAAVVVVIAIVAAVVVLVVMPQMSNKGGKDAPSTTVEQKDDAEDKDAEDKDAEDKDADAEKDQDAEAETPEDVNIDVPDVDTSSSDPAVLTDIFAQSFAEAYPETYSITNYDSTYIGDQTQGQMQITLYTSVASDGADAESLAVMFQQDMTSEAKAQAVVQVLAELEPYMGTDDLSIYFVLYYSDGVVCGESLFDGTGYIEGPYA